MLSNIKRSSGVLLHITSLPSRHGIGDLGHEAYRFVDFLVHSGQTWWQMFPLGPCGSDHSPYQVLSAFAGNSLLISLEKLAQDGFLSPQDLKSNSFSQGRIDFPRVLRFKEPLFKKAFQNFLENKFDATPEFQNFCVRHDPWLDDFSLFMALKEKHQGASWDEWSSLNRMRNKLSPDDLEVLKKGLKPSLLFQKFLQYVFFKQFEELKKYSASKGIGLIGDVPIFVSYDSADVWANPNLFWLDAQGRMTVVAGVPPDYFSKTGQRWGNPLYRWAVLRERNYDWWLARFQLAFQLFDVVRLDHFIGFHRYWEVAAQAKTAEKGRWVEVPGEDFFKVVFKSLPQARFIAEDLGLMVPEVQVLRDKFHLPGMKVLQFAFGQDEGSIQFLPHNYSQNYVVYTGTHDNDTTVGWFRDKGGATSTRTKEEAARQKKRVLKYLNSRGKEIHWDMIRLALMSVATTVIVPAQDLLGLGREARMNLPGTTRGNWLWRIEPHSLNTKIARRLYELTKVYGRTNHE